MKQICRRVGYGLLVTATLGLIGWVVGQPVRVAAQIGPIGSLDRYFTCYEAGNAAGEPAFDPRTVTLVDQFETRSTRVLTPALFCDPVGLPGVEIPGAGEHLACYDIDDIGVPAFSGRTVEVENLLGKRRLHAEESQLLCVPSTEAGAPAPAELDHFKCYDTSSAGGLLPSPLDVLLGDPFQTAPLNVLPAADLCNPVDKNAEGLHDPDTHLVCHGLGELPSVLPREVSFQNQFGAQRWQLSSLARVCLPSSKREVPPETPLPTGTLPVPLPSRPIDPTPTPTPTQLPTATPTPDLPPDPATVAPPNDPSVATNISDSTAFLYTGSDPIQTGVAPGTIEAIRAAVIRGKVLDRTGAPLSGVQITVLDHPELGETVSRADGAFDMAVNGGGPLAINYRKTGFLPSQRQVDVPWQDYVVVPDVMLNPKDPQVTTIDLISPTPMQVARGSVMADSDGSRQATLFVPAGTQAELVMADGTTQPTITLNVRLTEYTVGADGPKAMPGVLPPTSGYTYAVEIGADEAVAKKDGKDVLLSQPVFFYLENFLNFAVGLDVPTGFYDNDRAAWVPSVNGRVIKITGVTAGLADVDTVGDGSRPPLVLSVAERQQLANHYSVGQTLWRVPITHFSTWDHNWPFGPPPDATPPNVGEPETDESVEQCLEEAPGNSVIECQNQILGETVGVVGTPFTLDYRSDRVPGRTAAITLTIPLSGASVPASLKRIDLEIQVAGRVFTQTFPAAPNQSTTFTWDGNDAYGRVMQGSQPVTGSIGFVYDAVYLEPSALTQAFASFGQATLGTLRARRSRSCSRLRNPSALWTRGATVSGAGP